MADLADENARLRQELEELKNSKRLEMKELEQQLAKERSLGKTYSDAAQQKAGELDSVKSKMVKLTKQLDDEITKRDKVEAESQMLERRLVEAQDRIGGGAKGGSYAGGPRRTRKDESAAGGDEKVDATKAATKIIRTVDQWMRQKDLQQALLRGAAVNDQGFATMGQVLIDCPSLHTLDLSQNQLTMDSCSDLCQLITSCPSLTYISLEGNLLSLRAIGYFMTAIMERHNSKKLAPIDILDMQGNEGLLNAAADAEAENNAVLLKRVAAAVPGQLPAPGPLMICQVARSLWRFLHDTGHPQVKGSMPAVVSFHNMERPTLAKMESALSRILLLGEDESTKSARTITADMAVLMPTEEESGQAAAAASTSEDEGKAAPEKTVHLPPIDQAPSQAAAQKARRREEPETQVHPVEAGQKGKKAKEAPAQATNKDPFADLRAAFERPKEKCTTFNLKQIITKNGTILMNMLERLLESTSINARDVETGQTLLEYACHTGNIGLAKLCYRRGASLSARTLSGDTPFNISVKHKRYDLMEFLHTYGVRVNSCDAEGRTALHVATASNDVDAICRLIEWGADVNLRDKKERTPLHFAAIGGHAKVAMLLLEIGADMNAKDEKEFTAVAHAEAHDHFALMDRLINLGGRGHGLHEKKAGGGGATLGRSTRSLGELNVGAGVLKSSSLGRLGKVAVAGGL